MLIIRNRFDAGDVAVLYPSADPEHVELLMKYMDWTSIADTEHRIEPTSDGRQPSRST